MEQPVMIKFRWYVLLTMLVATVAQGMALISPAPLVGEIAGSMGKSLGEVTGAMMGVFILFVALSAVVGGILIDKIGIAKTYFYSLALLLLGSILIPFWGDSFELLLIARAIQGMGSGPIMASVSKVAAEWFPPKERAFVAGLQGAGVSLGIAIGFGLTPAIFAKFADWRIAMAWMAVGSLIALLLNVGYTLGPKSPLAISGELSEDNAEDHSHEFKQFLREPVFWIGVISVFCASWAMQGYNDITPGHLAVDSPVGLGLGPAMAGKYMGILQLSFMIGSLTSGIFITKIFKGVHRYFLSIAFILTGIFCVSVLLPVVYGNNQLLLICLTLSGFFMGMLNPAVIAFISCFYPEHITGRIGGITMGLSIFGGMAGVAIGSFVLHITDMYTIPILIVGLVCIVGTINAFGLNPKNLIK